jgi:hypothetical protein
MRQALATIPKSEQYAVLRPLTNKHLVIEARLSFDPTLDARLRFPDEPNPTWEGWAVLAEGDRS